MRSKNSGMLVRLEDGRIGVIYNRDKEAWRAGKAPVTIMNEDFTQAKDADGKPVRILYDTKKMKRIGMID